RSAVPHQGASRRLASSRSRRRTAARREPGLRLGRRAEGGLPSRDPPGQGRRRPSLLGGRLVSRRDLIRMTDEEQAEFLENGFTAMLTSIDATGMPHPVAMWYVTIDGLPHFATYTKSQKI